MDSAPHLAEAGGLPAKYVPQALLGLTLETLLSGRPAGPVGHETARATSPWDAWWACYRAALPLQQLGVQIALPDRTCQTCERDAFFLASQARPAHPDLTGERGCGCLLEWAIRMRAPSPAVVWPRVSLTLALAKPGAPSGKIRRELENSHTVLQAVTRLLTTDDTRRLYPEAYGADYVAARDAYLTSGPVVALILCRTSGSSANGADTSPEQWQVKDHIRAALAGDELRNHLHMPDNPGEAFADLGHLAGAELLAELYERYERDHATRRMAFYRAALGIEHARAHRSAS